MAKVKSLRSDSHLEYAPKHPPLSDWKRDIVEGDIVDTCSKIGRRGTSQERCGGQNNGHLRIYEEHGYATT